MTDEQIAPDDVTASAEQAPTSEQQPPSPLAICTAIEQALIRTGQGGLTPLEWRLLQVLGAYGEGFEAVARMVGGLKATLQQAPVQAGAASEQAEIIAAVREAKATAAAERQARAS